MLKSSLSILFALFTLLPAQSERSVIAITDVSAEGLSNIEIKMFYNWLESELVNLGQYDVTSRQEVDKILKEQKFQQLSGCTDQECAAEIGRMLNADLILLPSILYDSRSGVVSVSLKLVDVESARITTAITKDAEVQRVLDVNVLIRDYLVDLYRRDSEEKGIIVTPTPAEKVVGKGKLIIKSTPVGANVILDNENRGLTPLELDGIDEGKHRIILSYKGYERYLRSVMVTADVTNTIEGELVLLTGDMSIISEPSGSDVFLNDEYKGRTPLTLQHLEVGEYFVKLKADGYEDVLTKVIVEWDKENILNKILSPKPASVAFYSVPDGAEVFIDNRSMGKTSITGLKLELAGGKHRVKMKLKGYNPEKVEIELAPNEITDLELSLSKTHQEMSNDLINYEHIVDDSRSQPKLRLGRTDNSIDIGIKVSLNMAKHTGDDSRFFDTDPDFSVGFALGGFLNYSVDYQTSIRTEFHYSVKGVKFESIELKLNYLDIPVLILFSVQENINVFAGPYFSFFLGGKWKSYGESEEGDIDKEVYASPDFGLVFGGSYGLGKNISIEARYAFGLKTIDKEPDNWDPEWGEYEVLDIKNSVIQIMVNYTF